MRMAEAGEWSYPDGFRVTDTSPPPRSSVDYSECGSQAVRGTQCLLLPNSGPGGNSSIAIEFRHSVVTSLNSESGDDLPEQTGKRDGSISMDVRAVKALIKSDPYKTLRETIQDARGTREMYLHEIRRFLSDCKDEETPGAFIWYAGHGSRYGDWIFSNGVITLEELLEAYEEIYLGNILYIVSDCCYAGEWVIRLAKLLDENTSIGACGHQAKKHGYFLKLIASCQDGEKALYSGGYVKRGGVEKKAENGTLQFSHNKFLMCQTTMALDLTSMRCFRDPSSDCLFHDLKPANHPWKWIDLVESEKYDMLKKRYLFLYDDTKNQWYAVFLNKDKCDHPEHISEESLKSSGIIVAKGTGLMPPVELQKQLCFYSPFNYDPTNIHVNESCLGRKTPHSFTHIH